VIHKNPALVSQLVEIVWDGCYRAIHLLTQKACFEAATVFCPFPPPGRGARPAAEGYRTNL
jgi:hypothetical protein